VSNGVVEVVETRVDDVEVDGSRPRKLTRNRRPKCSGSNEEKSDIAQTTELTQTLGSRRFVQRLSGDKVQRIKAPLPVQYG
jgi:hypothetical protein